MIMKRIRTKHLIPKFYDALNLSAGFLSGAVVGYTREKSGESFSSVDVGFQLGVPSLLFAIENLTIHKAFHINEIHRDFNDNNRHHYESRLMRSNFGGAGTFLVGDYIGRAIANIF